jgi:membrane-bound lytic murein transglycosylase B
MRKPWWALVCALTLSSTGLTGSLSASQAPPTPPPLDHAVQAVADPGVQDAVVLAGSPLVTPPQRVIPGMLLVRKHHEDKRQRTRAAKADRRFFEISATGSNDIPVAALRAYHHAADVLAGTGCRIPWTFIAAIGRVESDHGRYGGSVLGADGVSRPEILGPVLDGAGPFAAIRDTDHGRLDHNKVWDRAVGQMQFLPSTWATWGRDGDGDGVKNPDDINDSALAAASYLCASGGDLTTTAGMARAAWSYNQSDYYVALVLAFERGYRTGVFVIPSPPAPATAAHHHHRHKHHARATSKKVVRHHHAATSPKAPAPSPKPAPSPSPSPKPSPKPTPTPAPTPTPTPTPVSFTSVLAGSAASGYTVAYGGHTYALALGPLATTAPADLDGDGTTETWGAELDGLVAAGKSVDVKAMISGSTAKALTVDGFPAP